MGRWGRRRSCDFSVPLHTYTETLSFYLFWGIGGLERGVGVEGGIGEGGIGGEVGGVKVRGRRGREWQGRVGEEEGYI